jgi:hypothetical protein
MGYYRGRGAQQIWQSPVETGTVQEPLPAHGGGRHDGMFVDALAPVHCHLGVGAR